MRLDKGDYTTYVDDNDEEYIMYDLEHRSTMEKVVYAIAELFDRSPTFRMQFNDALAAFGLKLVKRRLL